MIAGEHRLALPAGYQLGKYRFKEVLGAGGFGITYLAEDHSLGRRVAIKELLPNEIATRLDGSTVVAKTKSEEDNLAWARDRFMKEGKALAACEHANVVHVYEMIEANGTAYMVTKFEEGRSLSEWLKEVGGSPTETELRSILMPLLSGLEKVHKAGFLHRDLKPENIYITDDGRPLLLDFGSARQAVTDRTTSLTSIVTSGYAPFEQYHEDGKQGAWTDLYALAAVMYRAIHGKKPPEATRRLKDDPCLKLAREYSGKYSPQFLTAIDKALAVEFQKRPQSVAEWRMLLGVAPVETEIRVRPWWEERWEQALAFAREKPVPAAGAGAGVLLLGIVLLWKALQPAPPPPAPIPTPVLSTPGPIIPSLDLSTPAPKSSTPRPATPPPSTPRVQKETGPAPLPPGGTQIGPRAGEGWQNTLGQAYLPIPGTNVHMGITEVRRGDFEAFVRATGYNATVGALSLSTKGWVAQGTSWARTGFPQTAQHPVVGVSAYDALEFCRWLTAKERAEGKIDAQSAYRLPTDDEWSKAAVRGPFPWGDVWPPTVGAGNYAGQETKAFFSSSSMIPGYNDGYVGTSPTRTFQANSAGFYDLGGNAAEICGAWYRDDLNPLEVGRGNARADEHAVVLRGGSWISSARQSVMTYAHDWVAPAARFLTVGFRCVLAPVNPATDFALPPLAPSADDAPLEVVDGVEVVDRRLVAIWEFKPANQAEAAIRWEQQADGRYTVTRGSEILESGTTVARGGRLQQQVDNTSVKTLATYRLKTSTQLVTSGALGELPWRRIKALPLEPRATQAKTEDDPEDKDGGGAGKSGDASAPKPHNYDPPPHPKAPVTIERKARDLGDSIRHHFGF